MFAAQPTFVVTSKDVLARTPKYEAVVRIRNLNAEDGPMWLNVGWRLTWDRKSLPEILRAWADQIEKEAALNAVGLGPKDPDNPT
jgi:hypothetical protein